jgi:hypothetical protein
MDAVMRGKSYFDRDVNQIVIPLFCSRGSILFSSSSELVLEVCGPNVTADA